MSTGTVVNPSADVTTIQGATGGIAVTVAPSPSTSGGPIVARVDAAASNNATSVKASAGQLYGWYLYNRADDERFVKLYNKASSPSPGSDTPYFVITLPAGGGANVEFSMGIPFATGIAYAIVTGVSETDNTSVTADDVQGVLLYK